MNYEAYCMNQYERGCADDYAYDCLCEQYADELEAYRADKQLHNDICELDCENDFCMALGEKLEASVYSQYSELLALGFDEGHLRDICD